MNVKCEQRMPKIYLLAHVQTIHIIIKMFLVLPPVTAVTLKHFASFDYLLMMILPILTIHVKQNISKEFVI